MTLYISDMKLFKIILSFLLINPLIGLADITWDDFAKNITFLDTTGGDISKDTVESFVKSDVDANTAFEDFKEEITNAAEQTKLLGKTLESTVQENIEELLRTNNGQILLEKISTLLKDRKINFCWCTGGISADTVNFKIFLDPFDLYSATDFFLISGATEKEAKPEVYFFHEFVHLYHSLEIAKFNAMYTSCKANFMAFKEHFPDENDLDIEELETITGIPSSLSRETAILCENSYRQEKGSILRLNLLDGKNETLPTDVKTNTDLKREIERAKAYYLSPLSKPQG